MTDRRRQDETPIQWFHMRHKTLRIGLILALCILFAPPLITVNALAEERTRELPQDGVGDQPAATSKDLVQAENTGDDQHCTACGLPVVGKTFIRKDIVYCSRECYREHLPVCSVCGRRHKSCKEIGGDLYCSKCRKWSSHPRCTTCRSLITREHIESRGKTYCSFECYRGTLPVCSICGDLVSNWNSIGNEIFCPSCSVLERCFACGQPGTTIRLLDGRRLCHQCRETSIFDLEKAERLFQTVRERIGEELGLATDHQIGLELVDQHQLKQVHPEASRGLEMGHFVYEAETTTTYVYTRDRDGQEKNREKINEYTREKFRIMILHSLPESRFIEVAAHELAHDWMHEHLPFIDDPLVEEGFADFVASRTNLLYGHAHLNQRIEKNPDPTYGGGYRRMKALAAEAGGIQGLLARLAEQETAAGGMN